MSYGCLQLLPRCYVFKSKILYFGAEIPIAIGREAEATSECSPLITFNP